jgi:hypothetical protein
VKVPVALVTTVIQSPLPNWIGVRVAVHVHVGEDAEKLPHRRGVRFLSVDRFGEAGDVRDHVRVVDLVHRGEVAGVERVVALLHEREQAGGPAGAVGGGCHESSFPGRRRPLKPAATDQR